AEMIRSTWNPFAMSFWLVASPNCALQRRRSTQRRFALIMWIGSAEVARPLCCGATVLTLKIVAGLAGSPSFSKRLFLWTRKDHLYDVSNFAQSRQVHQE